MSSEGVQQLTALSELFRYVLHRCRPRSLAILGIAGGNGLEHIDPVASERVIGVDINQEYLDSVSQRFGALPGLELFCRDLAQQNLSVAPVDLVHAALIFEHAGLDRPIANALALVAPGGTLSVVLQLPSESEQAVARTGYASIQNLKQRFALIDLQEFQRLMAQHGFTLADQLRRPVAGGKVLWLGIFSRGE